MNKNVLSRIQEKENLTQAQRIGLELANIRHDITLADKNVFLEENKKISRYKLYNCLLGRVRNPDEGLRLLYFFKSRIKKREHALSEIK